ncbi:MAG TPA: family 20 glycosylhydrolase, partial [Segetibacter sp.]
MKKNLLFGLLVAITFTAISQNNINTLSIIPQPASVVLGKGSFALKNATVIQLSTRDTSAVKVAHFLAEKLRMATGYPFPVKQPTFKGPVSSAIRLALQSDTSLGKEGYTLKVLPNAILITASKPAGLFYGMQTLLQLLPKEIESKEVVEKASWSLPVVTITDKPRFGWRGLMFDVSRHFFTKQDVKTFIDDMVRYKYNLLHLHLADDEGWRIEIKGLPRLTEVGAWRPTKVGYFGTFPAPAADEPKNYGGFYTQDDIREIVRYAKDRFVDILPEIDVPGHSLAAVSSYP